MKRNVERWILWWTLFLLMLLTSCGSRQNLAYIDFRQTLPEPELQFNGIFNEKTEKPLRIAVSPILSQKDTIESYRQITEHIGKEMERETILIERKSYAEINVLLANGGADIAFLANGAYASYTGIEEIEPLVMQIRYGVPYYHSYIIVPEQSSAEKLEDLKGKTFAFTDPISYSGKIALVYMLKQFNETPETFFSNYVYTYGHQNSLEAVANHVVDGASIGSHVYDGAEKNQKDLLAKVRIIDISEKGGTGPVVARKTLGQERIKALQKIFLRLHEDPELKKAMSVLMVDRYIEPQLEYYEFVRDLLNEMDTEL